MALGPSSRWIACLAIHLGGGTAWPRFLRDHQIILQEMATRPMTCPCPLPTRTSLCGSVRPRRQSKQSHASSKQLTPSPHPPAPASLSRAGPSPQALHSPRAICGEWWLQQQFPELCPPTWPSRVCKCKGQDALPDQLPSHHLQLAVTPRCAEDGEAPGSLVWQVAGTQALLQHMLS